MYQLRAPASSLQKFIEHYWFVRHDGSTPVDLRVEVFVDARADLIFNFGAPYLRSVIGGSSALHVHSNLDAQRLVPIRISQRGLVRVSGVRFRLGGLGAFAHGQLRDWTGLTPEPRQVLGNGAVVLEKQLHDTADLDEQANRLDAFFLERLAEGGSYDVFRRILDELVSSDAGARVHEFATTTRVSHRQVERLFAKHLGIAPKTVARVLRFQTTLMALMRDPACPLAELAARAGYFDQAHFIKDFKRMSGGVPRGYRGYYPPEGPADFAPNVVVFLQDGVLPVA